MYTVFILSDKHQWSLPAANVICHESGFTQC